MFSVWTRPDNALCLQGSSNRPFAELLLLRVGRAGNNSAPSQNWRREVFRARLAAPRCLSVCLSRFMFPCSEVLVASADELYDSGAGKMTKPVAGERVSETSSERYSTIQFRQLNSSRADALAFTSC